jgi:hypothetical protein
VSGTPTPIAEPVLNRVEELKPTLAATLSRHAAGGCAQTDYPTADTLCDHGTDGALLRDAKPGGSFQGDHQFAPRERSGIGQGNAGKARRTQEPIVADFVCRKRVDDPGLRPVISR